MTPKRRAALKRALEQARAAAVAAGPARIEPNRTDPVSTGVADEDAQALSEMLQAIASQRNRGQADLVARVDGALRRLAAAPDDFGLCEDCDEEIDPRRLALMPWATRCAGCQEKRDPRRGGGRKSVTDFS